MVTAYNVFTNNGYIVSILHNTKDGNITEAEYQSIMDVVNHKPAASNGFDYRLTIELEWELYELPVGEEADDEEATAEDYETALAEMGVEV